MCISRQINQTLEILPRAYEEMKQNDLARVTGLKAKIPTEVRGDFTSDTENHVNYLSLHFMHQVGTIWNSGEYRWFTLAQITLIACFILPHHLFQLPTYSWTLLFMVRPRRTGLHLCPSALSSDIGAAFTMFSGCWCHTASGSCRTNVLRLTSTSCTVFYFPPGTKFLPINKNYVVQFSLVHILYMLHEATHLWEGVAWPGSHGFAAKSHQSASWWCQTIWVTSQLNSWLILQSQVQATRQDRKNKLKGRHKQGREDAHSLDARQWRLSPGKQPWGCASEKHWQLHQPQVREPLRLTLKAPHRNLYVWHCCLFVISFESKMCLCKTHVCCHYRSDLNKPCQSKDGRNPTKLLAACLLSFHMLI